MRIGVERSLTRSRFDFFAPDGRTFRVEFDLDGHGAETLHFPCSNCSSYAINRRLVGPSEAEPGTCTRCGRDLEHLSLLYTAASPGAAEKLATMLTDHWEMEPLSASLAAQDILETVSDLYWEHYAYSVNRDGLIDLDDIPYSYSRIALYTHGED